MGLEWEPRNLHFKQAGNTDVGGSQTQTDQKHLEKEWAHSGPDACVPASLREFPGLESAFMSWGWAGGSGWFIQPETGRAVRKGPSKVGSLCWRNLLVWSLSCGSWEKTKVLLEGMGPRNERLRSQSWRFNVRGRRPHRRKDIGEVIKEKECTSIQHCGPRALPIYLTHSSPQCSELAIAFPPTCAERVAQKG